MLFSLALAGEVCAATIRVAPRPPASGIRGARTRVVLFEAGARSAAVPLQRCWATASPETPRFTVSPWVRRVAKRLLGGYELCELTVDERRSGSGIPSETFWELAVFGESAVLAANRGLGGRVESPRRLCLRSTALRLLAAQTGAMASFETRGTAAPGHPDVAERPIA